MADAVPVLCDEAAAGAPVESAAVPAGPAAGPAAVVAAQTAAEVAAVPTTGAAAEGPVGAAAQPAAEAAKPVAEAAAQPAVAAAQPAAEAAKPVAEAAAQPAVAAAQPAVDLAAGPDSGLAVEAAAIAAGAGEAAPVAVPQIPNGAESKEAWKQREAELLKKIQDLQVAESGTEVERLKMALKLREDEVALLRSRAAALEAELQAPRPARNHEIIETVKQQHEELLSKAKGMIFDKTKVVKNQELQIEALSTQVASLKDINAITKDLLEIRNSEVKAMEDRLAAMEGRFTAERARHDLVLRKAETSSSLNEDLKHEYVTQLALFKELRVKYEERVQALVTENTRLKELRAAAAAQKELQKQ